MMVNHQKTNFRQHIAERIQSVKKDIISFKASTGPIAPDNAIGRISRMDAINSRSINEDALRKSKNMLARLECALKAVDDEDFGICIECDEPIPVARLMVLPETSLCVKCAERLTG